MDEIYDPVAHANLLRWMIGQLEEDLSAECQVLEHFESDNRVRHRDRTTFLVRKHGLYVNVLRAWLAQMLAELHATEADRG
jgi:hypothetical protein